MKFKIFKEITGKTQGIKFKINPPITAKISATNIEISFVEVWLDIKELNE